ncbi:hypothetical protein ACOZ35_02740 [Halorubrum xinjiangense]|uniref:hypothetical protein n=1 Tax=Halorubrum xinjiangense TaxID=261291 RepID=UPI003C6EDDF2
MNTVSEIVKLISESEQIVQAIRLLVFAGFFVFTAGCLLLLNRSDSVPNETVKKVFLLALVIGLIVPTLTGNTFPPFAGWYFFTDPAPESTTQYSVVLVNESGEEFDYPVEAAPPGRVAHRAGDIATNETTVPPDQMAKFLLDRAETHRKSIAAKRSPRERRQDGYVHNVITNDNKWSPTEAHQIGDLQTIRIYRTTMDSSPDGLRIVSQNRKLVYSYTGNTPQGTNP